MEDEKFKFTPQVIILFGLAALCILYFLFTIGARTDPNYKDAPAPSELKK